MTIILIRTMYRLDRYPVGRRVVAMIRRRMLGRGLCNTVDIAAAIRQIDPDNLPPLTLWTGE